MENRTQKKRVKQKKKNNSAAATTTLPRRNPLPTQTKTRFTHSILRSLAFYHEYLQGKEGKTASLFDPSFLRSSKGLVSTDEEDVEKGDEGTSGLRVCTHAIALIEKNAQARSVVRKIKRETQGTKGDGKGEKKKKEKTLLELFIWSRKEKEQNKIKEGREKGTYQCLRGVNECVCVVSKAQVCSGATYDSCSMFGGVEGGKRDEDV